MNSSTTRENIFQLIKELLWLTITAMAVFVILYPITSRIDFVYWKINAFFIFLTLTYFRYCVTFKGLPFLRPSWVRFAFFALNLSLFFFLMKYEQKFLILYENFYTEDFGFPKVIMYDGVKQELFKYLYREIVFFATGSLVLICAFQMRLFISYWQYYKHQADHLLES